jgi:hypothetical protein
MVASLEDLFPKLRGAVYTITSPKADIYNCMAWAAGETQVWWWPETGAKRYWPEGIAWAETFPAFQEAFAALGYQVCDREEPELGLERIALFADNEGVPTHAARQLPNGRWTSKLGELEDIEHALHDLEGVEYGAVVVIMKRPLPAQSPVE